jgi:hypothetical protein
MSTRRLKQILDSVLNVNIDSSQKTVASIQQQIRNRISSKVRAGKPPPEIKTPVTVPSLAEIAQMRVRPIDLLRKIGDLTTPTTVNMSSLSASWATLRYFWAIEAAVANGAFKLSNDARQMDFHQKTLLSDEFGIGFGGLVLERLFNSPECIDVSAALADPISFSGIDQTGSAQPDYLMWNSEQNNTYYVVECKGCQTTRAAALNQIRRGLEQIRSITFADRRVVSTLVVATLLEANSTTIYVIDPPSSTEDDESDPPKDLSSQEEANGREIRIAKTEEFSQAAWTARSVKLLSWAGQYADASAVGQARFGVPPLSGVANTKLSSRTVNNARYIGRTLPLFPELGRRSLRTFHGVHESVFEILRNPTCSDKENRLVRSLLPRDHLELAANASVGSDGTCLIVEL